jgi:translation initiation factor 3 subunit L
MENNLAEITVAYESGWNRLTEKFYAKTEWPEAEVIAPLVNDGAYPASLTIILFSHRL